MTEMLDADEALNHLDAVMGKLRKSQGATELEVAVATAVLESACDIRTRDLLEQLRGATKVDRRVLGSRLELSVPSTSEDLLVELDRDVVSRPVEVRDLVSGRKLSFRVVLRRGGFFGSLLGESEGGWPDQWDVDRSELDRAAVRALDLSAERPADPVGLARWLGVSPGALDSVAVRLGADAAAIGAVEQAEGAPMPPALRELLTIADGVVAGDLAILGTPDVFVMELSGRRPLWHFALDRTGPRYLLDVDEVVALPHPQSRAADAKRISNSLHDWVRTRLVPSSE